METENPQKDPLVLRCIKELASVDWKSMLLVLAALAGFGGAVWNRVDSVIEKAFQVRMQKGLYEVLGQKLDDVSLRLSVLEKEHNMKAASLVVPETHATRTAEMSLMKMEMTATPMKPVARLPTFEEVQKSAVESTPVPSLKP